MKAINKRLAELEAKRKSQGYCIILSIGGEDGERASATANISGMEQLKPFEDETYEQFCQRAYATNWARRPLEELSPEQRTEALAYGAEKVRTTKPIIIGGDDPAELTS